MSVDEIKRGLAALSPDEQREVTVFLRQLRQRDDPEHQALIEARMNDRNPANWLTVDEFMERLDGRSDGDEAV